MATTEKIPPKPAAEPVGAVCGCGILAFARCRQCARPKCRSDLGAPNGDCLQCIQAREAAESAARAEWRIAEKENRPVRLDEFRTDAFGSAIQLVWNDFTGRPRGLCRVFVDPESLRYSEPLDPDASPRLARMCLTGRVVVVREAGGSLRRLDMIGGWRDFEKSFMKHGIPWVRRLLRTPHITP